MELAEVMSTGQALLVFVGMFGGHFYLNDHLDAVAREMMPLKEEVALDLRARYEDRRIPT